MFSGVIHSRLFIRKLRRLYWSTLESESCASDCRRLLLNRYLRLNGFVLEKFNTESLCAFISSRSSRIFALSPCGRKVVWAKLSLDTTTRATITNAKDPFNVWARERITIRLKMVFINCIVRIKQVS